jgi:hypothetical protein
MRKLKTLMAVTAVVALAALLAPGFVNRGPMQAVQAREGCNLETIRGSYSFTSQGMFTDPNSVPAGIGAFVPVVASGVDVFDGAGNISGRGTASVGGLIVALNNVTGTYTMNPDCTGTFTFVLEDGSAFRAEFVVVDNGKEIRAMDIDPGRVAAVVYKKQ